ncbi:hypothetical protein GJ496_007747 [Pomphorhynchus laevis]|nr:hypothetical protein GJ496_007747 [Pomphorhynchus laevis]
MLNFQRIPQLTKLFCRYITDAERSRIKSIISGNKIVLFMKGTPLQPMCGFSKAVVQIFQSYNVPIQTYDILADSELREHMKQFTDWPTFPQVYINGEFKGGCDIMIEQHQNGELKQILQDSNIL